MPQYYIHQLLEAPTLMLRLVLPPCLDFCSYRSIVVDDILSCRGNKLPQFESLLSSLCSSWHFRSVIAVGKNFPVSLSYLRFRGFNLSWNEHTAIYWIERHFDFTPTKSNCKFIFSPMNLMIPFGFVTIYKGPPAPVVLLIDS